MQRWGYARLEEFGLLLTQDGRIVATRPAVLDDGLGGCVVGWRVRDLAALELAPWNPPAAQGPSPSQPVEAAPAEEPPVEAAPAEEPPDEDDWEWEIVAARARIAAEPAAEPASPTTMAAGSSRWLASTALAELDDGAAIPPVAKPAPRGEPGLATAPLRPSQLAINPATVIPVPSLPAVADPAAVARLMTPVRTQRPARQIPPAARPTRRVATRR